MLEAFFRVAVAVDLDMGASYCRRAPVWDSRRQEGCLMAGFYDVREGIVHKLIFFLRNLKKKTHSLGRFGVEVWDS